MNTQTTQEFRVGQLVSVNWDKLGEITEDQGNGYYLAWVEADERCKSEYRRVHASALEAVK